MDDPIEAGAKCKVSKPQNPDSPNSPDSSIFSQPSKYDQVFWPYTDQRSIWFCEKSGYASFASDFNKLTASEKSNIQSYLHSFQLKNPSQKEILQSVEDIYEMRQISSQHRNMLSRVFARWHQKLGNPAKAERYRKKALIEIESELTRKLKPRKQLEYLYLAANYCRLFNQIERSDAYLARLKQQIEATTEPKLKDYASYLAELAAKTHFIVPGKKIEPVLPTSSQTNPSADS